MWKVAVCDLFHFTDDDEVDLKDKVQEWSLSFDMDRVPFVSLRLTLVGVTPDWEWPRMDPRNPMWLIRFRADEYDETGAATGRPSCSCRR